MLTPGAFDDRQMMEQRLVVLRIVVGVVFGLLGISFWTLQVLDHARYRDAAENNHIRTIPRRAPRGVLFDRDGRVLVDNRQTQTISIVRERSQNMNEAIRRLAHALDIDPTLIADIIQRHRRDPLFRPIPIVEHATMEQVAAVRARELELPEVVVQEEPTRKYPADGLAAHLFGYVGEIQEAQLERPEFNGLQAGAIIGQSGLERVYNSRLMGQDGKRDVIVNSFGREMQQLGEQKAVEGQRLQLTIDLDLQRALEEAFAVNHFSGAAVFMDPGTGEILAMTSQPAFDPNAFATGVDRATWARLNTDPLRPLQDRLIQGMYSPGSTFKILMAVAGLSEGAITPETTFYCPGYGVFYGHRFACDKKEGHGTLDLRHAIEKSCNVYFYNVGSRLKIDTIHDYAVKLGLAGRTGIDLPGEVESLVPSSEWKMRTRGERWYPGETISVAIGQGQVSVTPIALATMITTVGNGGTVVTPHVVKAVDLGDGWQPIGTPAPRSLFPFKPEVLSAVHDGLWMVVNGAGTGGNARIEGYDVSGKTGTSQVISNQGKAAAAGKSGLDLRDNAWFEFFAPRDNPKISGVVMAEHAGHGGTASAPIAKYVMETFFAKREGRPLPKMPAAWTAKAAAPPAPTPAPNGGRQ